MEEVEPVVEVYVVHGELVEDARSGDLVPRSTYEGASSKSPTWVIKAIG